MMVPCSMIMITRTGWGIDLSATGLAQMATTVLAQGDPPPQVSDQFGHLVAQRHGLIEIGEQITDGGSLGHF
jgi:hypothetical protein